MTSEPTAVRSAVVDRDTLAYVSHAGYVVLAQGIAADTCHVVIDPTQVTTLIAALQRLGPVASAKRSAVECVTDAEYELWLRQQQ